MPPNDELALLRRVAAKDRKAFEALYHLYYRRLFGYLLKLTRRADLVEEVLNDVMLAVWKGAPGFDGRSRLSTWIFGIAYHKALKALARRPEQPAEEDRERPEPVDTEEPESLAVRRELAGVLGQALGALPAEQRAVVELTYYYGLAYQEIAEIVGCPVNTVKTRMFHARRRLRELLPGLGISSYAG
ncbi:MAG TPA: sigma-70 family RNA polymerase sigma factor [Thermoanaerobaculia bacterium]|jgi:RNA polymerase sigma-70 factor (ECF subfamily)|nr:sigma-70 family RNA polymerase sigma factor [Thermoanaerobaculia bacterium]